MELVTDLVNNGFRIKTD